MGGLLTRQQTAKIIRGVDVVALNKEFVKRQAIDMHTVSVDTRRITKDTRSPFTHGRSLGSPGALQLFCCHYVVCRTDSDIVLSLTPQKAIFSTALPS